MIISIVTAAYNSEDYILQTYESLTAQTHTFWEWLVTDDCSQDGTFKLLTELSKSDDRVKPFKTKANSGAAVARNISIKNATGDYLAFIDSDDLWLPKKLEMQLAIMREERYAHTFTAYCLVDEHGVPLDKIIDSSHSQPISYEDMLRKKATMGCSTVMLDRNIYSDISMPDIRTGQDYALWLSLLRRGTDAFPINEVLSLYRIRPDSISRNKFKKAVRQWQIYRDIESLGFVKSVECFAFYSWRAVFR